MSSYWGRRLSSVIVGVSDSFFPRKVRIDGSRLMALTVVTALCGCVSDKVSEEGPIVDYQQLRAAQGPQARVDTEGTNDQVVHVRARKFEVGQSGTPTLRIDIHEAGTVLHTGSEQNLTGSEVDLTETWDANVLAVLSGANVEIVVNSGRQTSHPFDARGPLTVTHH